ncbi:hypothetical protein AM231_14225 [Paenibacillus solani]|uniref:Uncharacterized protein n=1 Tax=Paenibacillus solani TaxID=1705565 RepID=A0A0M1P6R2_9BACL|nr:hypothetical protein AM231_14225 [Paenibacillus solani]
MLEVLLRNTILKPTSLSSKQAKAVLNNAFGVKSARQGEALPMTRAATILRGEPATNGFLDQLINTKSGWRTAATRPIRITSLPIVESL